MAKDRVESQAVDGSNDLSGPTESTEDPPKAANDDNDPTDEAKIGNFWVSIFYNMVDPFRCQLDADVSHRESFHMEIAWIGF